MSVHPDGHPVRVCRVRGPDDATSDLSGRPYCTRRHLRGTGARRVSGPRTKEGFRPTPQEIVASRVQTTTVGEGIVPARYPGFERSGWRFAVRRLTIPAGGSTGWHYHPYAFFAVIEEGELHHYGHDGRLRIFVAGEALMETPGARYAHCGVAGGGRPVRLLGIHLAPIRESMSIPTSRPAAWHSAPGVPE